MLDSTTNVTPGLEDRFLWVPLTVRFGDEEFIDGVTIQNDVFYEKLASAGALPTTSQAMPVQFSEAFEAAAERGGKIILITLSSRLSGTYQSAMLAARDFEGRVFVVDSRSVTIGAGILAEYALTLADSGMPAEEIYRTLLQERDKILIFGVLDTLEYLKKGGRISKAAALAGGILSIKPIARIQNGEIEVVGKARGMKAGFSLLKKEIERAGGVTFYRPMLTGYTGASCEQARRFIQENPELWHGHENAVPLASIGSVVGAHTGPGMTAVAFFRNQPD